MKCILLHSITSNFPINILILFSQNAFWALFPIITIIITMSYITHFQFQMIFNENISIIILVNFLFISTPTHMCLSICAGLQIYN